MSADGARHVLLIFVAIVGGIAICGASFYFFLRKLIAGLGLSQASNDVGQTRPDRFSWRDEWRSFRHEIGVCLVFGLTIAITGGFVWGVLRFW